MIGPWLRWRHGLRPASKWIARLSHALDPMASLLLDDAAGPALVIDASALVVRGNDALAAMLMDPDALVSGRSVGAVFHLDAWGAAREALQKVLWGHSAPSRVFVSVLASSGAGQDIRVTVMPLREKAGDLAGVLLRFVDITAQRELEAQLAHSQKLQATGQLAAGIAHDFNNLLTAILGAADGIVEREPDGETREDARQVHASAQRGAALVRQLLAFGRQQTLQPQILAVNAVIQDVSGMLRRLLGGQVRLVVALEQPGRRVRADPTQLDQVLVNLAVNARDAMPAGGELTLRSGHMTIYQPLVHGAETIPPGRYVMIEVQDTGGGIPADVLPHIFDPFFTTKREFGGSGLGLSTVHGIVRQSDGFLCVDSIVGKGTSMRIYLPRWDGQDPAVKHAARLLPKVRDATPAVVSRGLVLLVDDEDAVRRLAERALRRAGWDVLAADSGEAALETLATQPADAPELTALVSDMVMPGMDGAALAAAVRIACKRADLPVVFVSGYAESPLRGGLAAAGTLFLSKPYSLADLVATLAQATSVPP